MELSREQIDTALNVLTWAGLGFTALWAVTSLIGFMTRRAYNLTHAESGHSKALSPDFLNPDAAKRRAAITRGKAYDATLEAREVAAPAPARPMETASWWARMAALSTALLTLVAAVIGTVTKVQAIDIGVQQVSSMDSFLDIVTQHKVGAAVALAVIGSQIVVFASTSKKTLAGK
jgi:hypothetical protein